MCYYNKLRINQWYSDRAQEPQIRYATFHVASLHRAVLDRRVM